MNHLLQFIRYFDSSQVNVSWFWAQEVFHKCFSLEKFFSFRVNNKNDGSHLVQGLTIMVDWGRTDQSKANIFSCMILTGCGLVLSCSSYWQVQDIFLEDFYAQIAAFECKSVLSVWLHNFSSMKPHLWHRLWRFLVNHCLIHWTLSQKTPYFVTCNIEKQVISLLWKKTCHYGYTTFLILLTKSMRKPNIQLAHFSYLFQLTLDCGLGCVEFKY